MLGMVTPTFVMSTFEQIVGKREAELALMTAKLYNPEGAHKAGLIDVLVDDEDQLLAGNLNFTQNLWENFQLAKLNNF